MNSPFADSVEKDCKPNHHGHEDPVEWTMSTEASEELE